MSVDEKLFVSPSDLFGSIDSEGEEEEVIIKYDEYVRTNSMQDGVKNLKLALVSRHHSLWAEFVYNASRVLADYIDQSIIPCQGKNCLELGAGAGLPGLMAALNGCSISVITDYGTEVDRSLITAIDINITEIQKHLPEGSELFGLPYVWGYPVGSLCSPLGGRKFDIIFLADLIFNRSEHKKLLWTVKECLKPMDGVAWVSFSHHDPQKKILDLNFFTLAESEEFGFTVMKFSEQVRQSYPFVEQDGLDDQRGIVYIYTLKLEQ